MTEQPETTEPIEGDPRAAAPETPLAPEIELEDVTIGENTFKVQKGFAEQLKQPAPTAAPPAAAPAPPPAPKSDTDISDEDLSVLWYTNPSKAAKIIEERAYRRARSDYDAAEAGKAFWREFDERNPDLKPARKLAVKILQTEEKFRNMDDETGYRVLAEDTRALIRSVSGKAEPTPEPVRLEGATRAPAKAPAPKQAEQRPATISDWVRERRRQRQGAIAKKAS